MPIFRHFTVDSFCFSSYFVLLLLRTQILSTLERSRLNKDSCKIIRIGWRKCDKLTYLHKYKLFFLTKIVSDFQRFHGFFIYFNCLFGLHNSCLLLLEPQKMISIDQLLTFEILSTSMIFVPTLTVLSMTLRNARQRVRRQRIP